MAWRDEKRRALKRTTVAFAVERARRRMARQLGEDRSAGGSCQSMMRSPILACQQVSAYPDTGSIVLKSVAKQGGETADVQPGSYC
jgi:hypothetical protein